MKTILFVEDDEEFRALFCSVLKAAGYGVVDTDSVKGALSAVENQDHPFTVALLDFWLKGRSVIPLLDRLHENAPETVIVLITGGGESLSIETVRSLSEISGPLHFLQKPFSGDELLGFLDRITA